MKDAVHHLKHVQRKVLQSVRKSENSKRPVINGTEVGQAFGTNTPRVFEREKKKSGSG